jgi:hypothetical protein
MEIGMNIFVEKTHEGLLYSLETSVHTVHNAGHGKM